MLTVQTALTTIEALSFMGFGNLTATKLEHLVTSLKSQENKAICW